MKQIRLFTPKADVESFFLGLHDDEISMVTPLIYLKKSKRISKETYQKLISKIKIGLTDASYIPEVDNA